MVTSSVGLPWTYRPAQYLQISRPSGGSVVNVTNVTNVNYTITPVTPAADPKVQQDLLYGRAMAVCALGKARLGGNVVFGPYLNDGKVTFGVSFGLPVDVTGTRVAFDIALDSQIVWRSTAGGTLPADGTFLAEAFTFRFYGGTLTQAVDPLETQYFPAEAIAYRPQMLLFIENLPYARFIKPVPYVSCLIGDTTDGADPDDGINLGDALERIAYSPWSGYTSSTFDAPDVTDVVQAVLLKDNFTIPEICEAVTRGYKNLTLVQSDKLYLRDHGTDVFPSFTFDTDNIMRGDDPVMIMRSGPSAQARELELEAVDPALDYTTGTSLSQRARDPLVVSAAAGRDSFSIPAVMTAATRQVIVTYAQYYEENARKRIRLVSMAEGYEIEPGDKFAISDIADGIDDEVFKAIETSHSPDYTVDVLGEAIMRCAIGYAPTAASLGYFDINGSGTVFNSVDIGAAADDRLIVVVAGGYRSLSPGNPITSVTIGGIAATLHEHVISGAGVPDAADAMTVVIASAIVPTGTTADISVTNPGSGVFISVYRFTGLASNAPYDTASDGASGSSASVNLNVPVRGIVLAGYLVGGSGHGAVSWTGLSTVDEDDFLSDPAVWASVARQSGLSAETGRTISVTGPASGGFVALVAASFA